MYRSLAAIPIGRPSNRAASPAFVRFRSPEARPAWELEHQHTMLQQQNLARTHLESNLDEPLCQPTQRRDKPACIPLSKHLVGLSATTSTMSGPFLKYTRQAPPPHAPKAILQQLVRGVERISIRCFEVTIANEEEKGRDKVG